MRLKLAVVLACCRADDARRRPARPMRQRDVDRWRARQRQHTYKPPAGARDAFKEQLARLRQQTIDAKHKQQPPPQAPHRPTPIPVNITCPATRRGCAYDREGGFGAGLWESATPREDGWMERWHWRLGTEEEYNRTRDALAWRWRAACRVCAMTPPADLVTPAQLCARFAEARVRRLLVVGDSTSQGFYDALVRRLRATNKIGIPFPDDPKKKKFAMTRGDACNTSLRLAFLRDDYLWGDGAILPNATCTALAGQDLAVLDKCGDRGSPRCHGRFPRQCRDNVVDTAHWASSLLPKWDVVVANTGAHQRDPVAMAHAVAKLRGSSRTVPATRRSSSAASTVPSTAAGRRTWPGRAPRKKSRPSRRRSRRGTWIPRTEAVPNTSLSTTRTAGTSSSTSRRRSRRDFCERCPTQHCTTSGRS